MMDADAAPMEPAGKLMTPGLLLIDGIGPFFRFSRSKRINWSKIPFRDIEDSDGLRPECAESIRRDFRTFLRRAREFGYNAVSIDDLAHMLPPELYRCEPSAKIAGYRELYADLIGAASEQGVRTFVTTDVMFYNAALERCLGRSIDKVSSFLAMACKEVFGDFPGLAGVILRIGEADGRDVSGDFRSRLVLKTPDEARALLSRLLPVFSDYGRTLIARTWTLGAYPIGDLMWNSRTFERTFRGLEESPLVISMKYGESDFFRYLETSPLFFLGGHKKIVEFQARREYEGFGAYPSFVGWDCERHLRDLAEARNLVGASVWCQTGGWGRRRQLTFVRNSSIWVELNAYVIPALAKGHSCEDAVNRFCRTRQPEIVSGPFKEFLRLSETAVKRLLYVREIAERPRYFRRIRIPPQLFVFWDRIVVNRVTRAIIGAMVKDRSKCLAEGRAGLAAVEEMRAIARANALPAKGLRFQADTFRLLETAREFYFGCNPASAAVRLAHLKREYRSKYRRRYSVLLDLGRPRMTGRELGLLASLLLRECRNYRLIDRVVGIRLLGGLRPLLRGMANWLGASFATKQTMGIDTLLK